MPPDELSQALAERIAAAAKAATGSASRVRRVKILPHEPSLDRGEVTEKGSLNQRALRTHNARTIEAMYRTDDCIFIA
jgi:feruloyl-CoA synthase